VTIVKVYNKAKREFHLLNYSENNVLQFKHGFALENPIGFVASIVVGNKLSQNVHKHLECFRNNGIQYMDFDSLLWYGQIMKKSEEVSSERLIDFTHFSWLSATADRFEKMNQWLWDKKTMRVFVDSSVATRDERVIGIGTTCVWNGNILVLGRKHCERVPRKDISVLGEIVALLFGVRQIPSIIEANNFAPDEVLIYSDYKEKKDNVFYHASHEKARREVDLYSGRKRKQQLTWTRVKIGGEQTLDTEDVINMVDGRIRKLARELRRRVQADRYREAQALSERIVELEEFRDDLMIRTMSPHEY